MTAVIEHPCWLYPHLLGEMTPLFPSQPPTLIFIPTSLNHPPSGFEGEHLLLRKLLLQQLLAVSSMQCKTWARTATHGPVTPLPTGGVTTAVGTGQHPLAGCSICPCCAAITPIPVMFESIPVLHGSLAACVAFCRGCNTCSHAMTVQWWCRTTKKTRCLQQGKRQRGSQKD